MSTILELDAIHFSIKPHFWSRPIEILQGVSLQVPQGSLYGFLGPNGAGKTTTLKAILGLIQPTSGSVRIMGGTMRDPRIRQQIGFAPEHPVFPDHLTSHEFLLQHARLSGLSRKTALMKTEQVLEEVRLAHAAKQKLRTYSKGMLQRAGLAQALLGKPQFILLDEPMGGVDPVGRREIREIMMRLRDNGATIFFSTHILPDVELICDHVGILVGGQMQKTGTPAQLTSHMNEKIEVVVRFKDTKRPHLDEVVSRTEQENRVVFQTNSPQQANQLIDTCRGIRAEIIAVNPMRSSLEDLFVTEFTASKDV